MSEKANNFKLGLFISLATICFIVALYFLGSKQNLFGGTIEVKTIFNNVNGLQKGNNVRFSGIDVGTVKEIIIINDTTIEVSMMVNNDVHKFIKTDAITTLGNDGLMGNKLVNISPGNSNSPIIQEGGTLLSINELDADEMLRRLEETNRNIALITEYLVDIIKDINQGKGAVGLLLNDNSLANDLSESMKNIRILSTQTTELSRNIEKNLTNISSSENTIGMLLTDTALAYDIRNTVHQLQQFGSNTQEVTSDLKLIVNEMQAGKGSVGALISDSLSSENIKKSLDNLQKGSKAFQENMEALKHNFLFRRYFRKLEKKEEAND